MSWCVLQVPPEAREAGLTWLPQVRMRRRAGDRERRRHEAAGLLQALDSTLAGLWLEFVGVNPAP